MTKRTSWHENNAVLSVYQILHFLLFSFKCKQPACEWKADGNQQRKMEEQGMAKKGRKRLLDHSLE